MLKKFTTLTVLILTVGAIPACSRDIRTVDDVVRAAGSTFEDADLWQTNLLIRLNRPTHVSEWEGIIYSDGRRYAAIINGASKAGQIQSHLVIDGGGNGWLRITEAGGSRVFKFDPRRAVPASVDPESFILPGNPSTGNPLGMFLDPARALRILSATYDLRLTRRTHVEGDPVLGFSGIIKPGALDAIDPDRYLAENDLPIQNVDVTVRLYDGAPKRIQFMDQGIGYFIIDYSEVLVDPDVVESRFDFDSTGAEVIDLTQSSTESVAGVDEDHVLFEWDETRRVLPRAD